MREVRRYFHVYEAQLAAAFLRSHGVRAEVADEQLATTHPYLQQALGGVRVLAPDDQTGAAVDLLHAVDRGEHRLDLAEGDEPAAGSPAPGFKTVTALMALSVGVTTAGPPYRGGTRRLGLVQKIGFALLAAWLAFAVWFLAMGALYG